jgi:hypothetical protein
MPLPTETADPTEVVDLVFAKLSVTYGHRFLSIWDGMPLDVVKADWAKELAPVKHERILWALQNLPERAPDAPTFRALCACMPQPREAVALPSGPKKPAPAVARAFAEVVKNAEPHTEPERVRWARQYVAKWGSPDAKPTFFQRDMLVHAKRIVERYEALDAETLEMRKVETQQRVDAYQEES